MRGSGVNTALPCLGRVLCFSLLASAFSCEAQPPDPHPDPLDPTKVAEASLQRLWGTDGDDTTGSNVLHKPGPAALLRDGSLAVVEAYEQRIFVFDSAGGISTRFGRRGGGPGEFNRISALAEGAEGGFVVWDVALARISLFRADGGLESTAPLPLGPFQSIRPTFVGVLKDGSVLFREDGSWMMDRREEPSGTSRDSIRFFRYFPGDGQMALIATILGPEYSFYNQGSVWGAEALLLGRKVLAEVTEDRLVVADTDFLSLTFLSLDGREEERRSLFRPSRQVSQAEIDLERQLRIDNYEDPLNRPGQRITGGVPDMVRLHEARVSRLPAHRSLPAFSRFLVADRDTILLQDHNRPGELGQRWYVLAPDLTPMARFYLNEDDSLIAFRGNRIAVLSRDSFGSESVSVFSLISR
jgi:hypothetical protein